MQQQQPKVLGYMPLHYGRDFLREALLAVLPFVDKFLILYSPRPSYGYQTSRRCPDTEALLRSIAEPVLRQSGKPWVWQTLGRIASEGEHRNLAVQQAEAGGFDLLLAVDADEVMDPKGLPAALQTAFEGKARYYGISGYINLWRTFDYACYDHFEPVRITKLAAKAGGSPQATAKLRIWHFGCCQSPAIMNYKYEIHGHKHELRANYLNSVYYAWTPEKPIHYLHPVSLQIWKEAVPYDKSEMPEMLQNHPLATAAAALLEA